MFGEFLRSVFYVLTRRDAKKAARERRITEVADRYVASAVRTSGISGAITAGVLTLPDGKAVGKFLDQVAERGEVCLGPQYRNELRDNELLDFFKRCLAMSTEIQNEGKVLQIIQSIHNSRR